MASVASDQHHQLLATTTKYKPNRQTDRLVFAVFADFVLFISRLLGILAAFVLRHTREDSENFLASALNRFPVGKFAYDSILCIALG